MGRAATPITYRPEIDGLRAIAVLPITLFHAGITGFNGGFVGVDIFFVISGFLITSIVMRDIEHGSFTFANFYERRARRILPALFGVLTFTLIAAWFTIAPSELSDFGGTVIGTIFFVANIVFWQRSGYFADSASELPLLHMWSLGVEEQFYIVYPIALLVLCKYSPRLRMVAITSVLALSLALCIALTHRDQDAAFYLLPTRAWELLAGALAALGYIPRFEDRPKLRQLLAALGGACVVIAIFAIEEGPDFPGAIAILPVLGSLLIIGYSQNTFVGRALSVKPLVFVGLLSYSLYLWHWPIIVFGNKAAITDGSLLTPIVLVAVSILASIASFYLVESPCRDKKAFPQPRLWRSLAATGTVLAGCGALAMLSPNGLAFRFSESRLAFDEARNDFSPRRADCHIDGGVFDESTSCTFGSGDPATVVWGDSQGVELAYALGQAGVPVRQITSSSCPPVLGFEADGRPLCRRHNEIVFERIAGGGDYDTVIIASFYQHFLDDSAYAPKFRETVSRLVAAGKRVIVVGSIPSPVGLDLPRTLFRTGEIEMARAQYDAQYRAEKALLDMLETEGAQVVRPRDIFCDARVCALTTGGKPVLFDSHHPSNAGADAIADQIVRSASFD